MQEIFVKIPNYIKQFLITYPKLIKRMLVIEDRGQQRVVAWSSQDPKKVVRAWKSCTSTTLRLVPTFPKEGGTTQMAWNQIWDDAEPLIRGVRKLKI